MIDREDYQPEGKKTKDNHQIKSKIESEKIKVEEEDIEDSIV